MNSEDRTDAVPDWFRRAVATPCDSCFVEVAGCSIHYLRTRSHRAAQTARLRNHLTMRVLDDPRSANTLPQLIRAASAAYGGDLAITLKGETVPDDSATFSELDCRSAQLARGLLARGIGKGARVGFIYGNSPTFAVILAAISRIGAIAIPISTMIRSNELVRVLRQSDVSGLIMQRRQLGHDYVDRLCEALPELLGSDNPDLRLSRTPYLRWGAITICTERTLNNSRVAMGSVLAEDDIKLMANAKPFWGLGMSETLGPYTYSDEMRAPGFPLCAPLDHIADRYEMRVADEDGIPVGDAGTGEVQVRGYALTPGLHKVERSEYFTPDGFYRTGDMGLREGSRVHFIGRGGDMIKTAGANVSPAEVEMEMQQLDGVHSAYVVGLPDSHRGQLLVAAVVPREGAVLDVNEIEVKLRQRLSAYKVPRAYVTITREEIPLLHSNKVARREIARMLAEKLGRNP